MSYCEKDIKYMRRAIELAKKGYRLNYFLQNNKPISNFNNPIKNLTSDENETPIPPKHPLSVRQTKHFAHQQRVLSYMLDNIHVIFL